MPNSGLTTARATVVYCLAGWTSIAESWSAAEGRGRHTEELKGNRECTKGPRILQFNHKNTKATEKGFIRLSVHRAISSST